MVESAAVPNQVTFLDMLMEMFLYKGFRGQNRSHFFGFTVIFDYGI